MTVAPRGLSQFIALVCALHALALWLGLERRAPGDASTPRPAAVLARWIAPPPVVRADAPAPVRAELKPPSLRGQSRRPAAPEAAAAPSTETDTATASPPPGPAPPVEAEPALRADSVQRAVRETVRRKSLSTLAGDQLGRPEANAETALQNGMASAARSDCLKGGDDGYARQGLGLFALPMLAIDLARGRCTK
jgi:hypothetical protein